MKCLRCDLGLYQDPKIDNHTKAQIADFNEFGKVIGIKESRVAKIIKEFIGKDDDIDHLVDRSFLKDEIKADFKRYSAISRRKNHN